ncbi:MAG: SDR family NAD(P)-dependent oxidoreductase [Chitinophagaceae bacterium]|nr:SDR family NAD(P)-dependent oxidoreductase [Chitinophagaceae bacterium]
MDKQNSNKLNIIITGASRGIGRAIAEKFAAQGYNLFLCAHNEEKLAACADELKLVYNIPVKAYAADLSDKEQTKRFGAWVLENCDQIGILVNNAGNFLPGSVNNEDDLVLEKMIAINLYSAYHLTRLLLPVMMKQKHGHIFNMCSIASLNAYPNGGSYSISKFALMGFNKNLREEMRSFNIKVTGVYPGAVFTDSWAGSGVDKKRIMESADIADMIYAASRLSAAACVEDIVLRPQLGDL